MTNIPKHSHSDRDKIYTPEPIAKQLITRIPFSICNSWCDPCLGSGVFFNNFPNENREWFEIDKGKDFLTANGKWDWCVTNIPFSQPKEFIFKMAECSIKGFGVLCLANSMTATRLKKLESMGFVVDSVTCVYIKDWGFGYRTDFYVFIKDGVPTRFTTLISEKSKEEPRWFKPIAIPMSDCCNSRVSNYRAEYSSFATCQKCGKTISVHEREYPYENKI